MLRRAFRTLVRTPGASNSITLRLKLPNDPSALAKVTAVISDQGGNLGAIDIVRREKNKLVRDLTVDTCDPAHADEITKAVQAVQGIELVNVSDRTFLLHLGGKLEVQSKFPLNTRDELSMAYTPGVARVCQAIAENDSKVWNLTIKRNTVAVVTDGTAVLGLGDIGPKAAMPVMEGKAQLFKTFAGVDAFPICLDTKDPEEIIKIVKALSPGFGGINLEDISAPRCFDIEKRLKKELDIPVFHDDQHGTAVVLGAAFINALRLLKRDPSKMKAIVCGVGASGTACTKMLLNLGVKNIIGIDRKGALSSKRTDLDKDKRAYRDMTNPNDEHGTVHDVIKGADIFIGLSGPNVINVDDVKNMNKDPLVFAMSNPTPEIMPEDAMPHVAIMATGRSDYPNQINNVLAFPGIFRGALDVQASDINDEMALAAAKAIAHCIPEDHLTNDYIIPSVFNKEVVHAVAAAVSEAAYKSGVARRKPPAPTPQAPGPQ